MKKLTFIIASLALLGLVSSIGLPVMAATTPPLDYSGLVKCDGVVKPGEEGRKNTCNFIQLMKTIGSIVNYMFYISIPIAVALFAYGGVLYLTGREKNISKAKDVFLAVGIGFIIMLVAWFAVYTAVDWFVDSKSGATLFIK